MFTNKIFRKLTEKISSLIEIVLGNLHSIQHAELIFDRLISRINLSTRAICQKNRTGMKKLLASLLIAGLLSNTSPLNAAVSKMRAVKCSIPPLHQKFQCTAEEKAVGKKWLIGASIAAAVAALAAIVVGGVKYNQVRQAKKEAVLSAQREAEAEKARQANQAMMRTETEAQQGALSQEQVQAQIQALLDQIGEFDDNPMTPQERQKQSLFKQYFLEKIDVIKGGPQRLRQALDLVKEQIRSGAIKTKEGAVDAYYKAVDFANNLPSILENAIGVSLQKMNAGYKAITEAFETFKTALSDPQKLLGGASPYPAGKTFFSSVKSLGSYLLMIDQMSDDAEDAQEELSLRRMIDAKSLTPEKYKEKNDAFDKEEKMLVQKRQNLQNQLITLTQAQGLSADKIRSKQAELEKENLKLAANEANLKKNRQILAHKENFDRFASPKYWSEKYFPEIMKRINALQLKNAGRVLEVLMAAFGKVFAAAEFLNKHGGAIGNRLFDTQRVGHGLRTLNKELPALGSNLRELLAITPIILVEKLSPRQIGVAALKAMIQKKAKLFRQHKAKLQHIVSTLQAIKGRYDPLHQKLRTFNKWLANFKDLANKEIRTALFKEKAIKRAAQIARDAVISIIEKQKIAFNEVLTELPFITSKLTEMLPDVGTVFVDLNTNLKSIIGMEAINPAFIQKLAPIFNARIPNIHQAIKDIVEGSKNYAAPSAY